MLCGVLAAVRCCLAAACSGEKQAAPSGPPANAKTRRCSRRPATCHGRVTIEGAVPANPPIKMSRRIRTAREQNPNGATLENFVVDNGGLENVFVYVKDGLGDYYFDVPTEPVKLDQKGCHYTPHVLGVRAGQTLEISNSDDTLHNVHAMPTGEREFNQGQAMQEHDRRRKSSPRRSDGAVQVRRAQLDARVHRRAGSPVLRRHATTAGSSS